MVGKSTVRTSAFGLAESTHPSTSRCVVGHASRIGLLLIGLDFGIFSCRYILALCCLCARETLKQLVRCLRVGRVSVFLDIFESWYVGVVTSVMTVRHADPPGITSRSG